MSTTELPTGTVTFSLIDIEGSTRPWAEAPYAMRAALEPRCRVPIHHFP